MKYLSIFILLLFFITPKSFAQDVVLNSNEIRDFGKNLGNNGTRTIKTNTYKGTPFFSDWIQGHIIINDETISEPMSLRFDMEQNRVIFNKEGEMFAIPEQQIKGFVINATDKDINFRNGFNTNEGDISQNTMLRVMYEGNVKLLAHHNSELIEVIPTYGSAQDAYEYVDRTKYYLVTQDGEFHRVKLKDKDILEVLNDKEKELKSFADANNLDYNEEPELVRILSHYDEISLE